MKCRFCGSSDHTKSGFVRSKQRYKCLNCHKHYIEEPSNRGIDSIIKAQALLALQEGKSLRTVAKSAGVSATAALKWKHNLPRSIEQLLSSINISQAIIEINQSKDEYDCAYIISLIVPKSPEAPTKIHLSVKKL